MSSLTLKLNREGVTSGRLDLSGVVPDRLLSASKEEIARFEVDTDRGRACLDELFSIEDGSRDRLILSGDLSRADAVGGEMREGLMVVQGSVGRCAAQRMRGGHLIIQGDAGDFACGSLMGGWVAIAGNVGDYAAGAVPGTRRGMRGGKLHVRGRAGRFLGSRMRRGTVVVEGSIDQGAASAMIAGTIVCCRVPKAPLGVGMKRGTLLILAHEQPELHAGFTALEPTRLSYIYLLLDSLRDELPHVDTVKLSRATWLRAVGDRASGGMGELVMARRPSDARQEDSLSVQ